MAEPDTVSNSSSTLSSTTSDLPDITIMPDVTSTQDVDTDSDLQAAAGRLDTVLTLQPDVDIATTLNTQDSDSVGAASTSSSSVRDAQDPSDDSDGESAITTLSSESSEIATRNGPDSTKEKPKKNGTEKNDKSSKSGGKKSKNPLRLLKKLTKSDKGSKTKKKEAFSEFEQVRIDRLPQVFVAKYLGMREVRGFCGLHHVRKPVDEMVTQVQKNLEKQEQVELPLVYVVVSPKGLDVRAHKMNKQTEGVPLGMVPIDFISYGVQDIKYWRVFTFIVVKELSSRSKVTECHAYLCDSSLNARKMALSLGASFKIYSRSLKKEGKFHNFQVELRPPDELAEALTEQDCDA